MTKLYYDRGTTKRFTYYHRHGDQPYPLDNATVRFTVKKVEFDNDDDDSTAIISKDFTNGSVDGWVEILLLPNETKEIAPGEYIYDIKVDDHSDGTEVYKVIEGEIEIDGSPTNRL